MIRVLFLAANPPESAPLRLDEEIRMIQRRLDDTGGIKFDLRLELAVRRDDFPGLLMRYQPHIVHFAGHGTEEGGIVFQDEVGAEAILSPQVLAEYFSVLTDNVQCVILNSCYGAAQAHTIAKSIDSVIAMKGETPDDMAIRFSRGFYEALARGRSVSDAFEVARLLIKGAEPKDERIPKLFHRKGIDPTNLQIVGAIPTPILLDAHFEMDGVRPWSKKSNNKKSYQVWISLLNLPSSASIATYLYLDDSFDEDIDECTNLHDNFRTYLVTCGDLDIGVIVYSGLTGQAFKTTLDAALDRHYGLNPPASIATALDDIKGN